MSIKLIRSYLWVTDKVRDINEVLFSCLRFYISFCVSENNSLPETCLSDRRLALQTKGRIAMARQARVTSLWEPGQERASDDYLPFRCLTLFKWNCSHLSRMCGLIFFIKASIIICPESYIAHLWRNHVEEMSKVKHIK